MVETKRPKEIARTEKVSRAMCKPESEKKILIRNLNFNKITINLINH